MPSELEQVGALYVETQRLLAEYRSLLSLLDRVVSGDVPHHQVRVDLEKMSWAIVLGEEPGNDAS